MMLLETYFKVSLVSELDKFPKLSTQDIAEIQKWIGTQAHLPSIPDILIAYFLHTTDYDLEKAKTTVRLHCEYKRDFTEFFSDWNPMDKDLCVQYTHVFRVGFLPKESCSQSRILLVQVKADSAEMYSYAPYNKWLFMSLVCHSMLEGMPEEYKVVIDSANFTFSHFWKSPAQLVNKYQLYTNHASTNKVREIHFINFNSAVKKMFGIFSFIMSKKTQNVLHFHGDSQEFFKSCSAEVVPVDYGGSGPSVQTIHDENTNRVLSSRNALMEFCNLKAKNI